MTGGAARQFNRCPPLRATNKPFCWRRSAFARITSHGSHAPLYARASPLHCARLALVRLHVGAGPPAGSMSAWSSRDRGDWLSQIASPRTRLDRGRTRPPLCGAPRPNTTGGLRVWWCCRVDGVNAVTGQTANSIAGRLRAGTWESAEINGWRKSLDDSAQIRASTDLARQLRPQHRTADNVGVIGSRGVRGSAPIATKPPPVCAAARGCAQMPASAREGRRACCRGRTATWIAIRNGSAKPGQRPRARAKWAPVRRDRFPSRNAGPRAGDAAAYDDYEPWSRAACCRARPDYRGRRRGAGRVPAGLVG
jgi:hypothetical protein